jgi:hypothetical protein
MEQTSPRMKIPALFQVQMVIDTVLLPRPGDTVMTAPLLFDEEEGI